MNDASAVTARWDGEYLAGKYKDELPIDFVEKITDALSEHAVTRGKGVYIGCGNGRNYLPLINKGLDILGIEISSVAIDMIRAKYGDKNLKCADFMKLSDDTEFDYVIAIQILQHGTEAQIRKYFKKIKQILRPGGLFFLRVNSVSTDIYWKHDVIEKNESGGFTVLYASGPKKDLKIHFYSQPELHDLCKDFQYVTPPYECVMKRSPPMTGSWSQWETIMKYK